MSKVLLINLFKKTLYTDYDTTYHYDPSVYDTSTDTSSTEKQTLDADQQEKLTTPVIVVDDLNHRKTSKNVYGKKETSLEELFKTTDDDYVDQSMEHPSRRKTNDLYFGTDETEKRPVLLWTKKTSNLNLLAAEVDPDELLERMQQNVNIDLHFGSMLNLQGVYYKIW